MKMRKMVSALALGAALACAGHAAKAELIYEVIDTVDSPGAPNRMKYIYHYSEATPAFHGLTITFDAALYAELDALTPGSGDWLASVTQPDPTVPLEGVSSFMALNSLPAGKFDFEVGFTWLGTGTPGAQSYERVDDLFNVVASGRTALASQVPEPGTGLLFLVGALVLARQSARYRTKPKPQ
ncbi:PEP-CTERM sorting domain-containing protein [Pseudoduganella sp. LjRoot289]|uniref:PEP-CTERM sorting domain-containing protein n=1 Tax=Pseudoduganella sp. LjRoot289 TaxID=3342314 RepID=UPI003ECD7579